MMKFAKMQAGDRWNFLLAQKSVMVRFEAELGLGLW